MNPVCAGSPRQVVGRARACGARVFLSTAVGSSSGSWKKTTSGSGARVSDARGRDDAGVAGRAVGVLPLHHLGAAARAGAPGCGGARGSAALRRDADALDGGAHRGVRGSRGGGLRRPASFGLRRAGPPSSASSPGVAGEDAEQVAAVDVGRRRGAGPATAPRRGRGRARVPPCRRTTEPCAVAAHASVTVTLIIFTGVRGRSSAVGAASSRSCSRRPCPR